MPPDAIDSFITRWESSGAAERANYQMFLSELCDILEVPRPDPTSPDPAKNLYVFDRPESNVAAVYDRRANEEAPSLSSIGIDGHRPPQRTDRGGFLRRSRGWCSCEPDPFPDSNLAESTDLTGLSAMQSTTAKKLAAFEEKLAELSGLGKKIKKLEKEGPA